jgi:hypothetical protein
MKSSLLYNGGRGGGDCCWLTSSNDSRLTFFTFDFGFLPLFFNAGMGGEELR